MNNLFNSVLLNKAASKASALDFNPTRKFNTFTERNSVSVINKYHKRENLVLTDIIYIGRGSSMGNEFTHLDSKFDTIKVRDRTEAVVNYYLARKAEIQLYLDTGTMTNWVFEFSKLIERIQKNASNGAHTKLECFCKPQICHGDALLKLLDQYAVPVLLYNSKME